MKQWVKGMAGAIIIATGIMTVAVVMAAYEGVANVYERIRPS